jgi:hypothetical protein
LPFLSNPSTPTGSVTFYICTGVCTPFDQNPPQFEIGTAQLTPNPGTDSASATSPLFSPPTAGTYCFDVYYNGDNYYAPESHYGDPGECFTASGPSSPSSPPARSFADLVYDYATRQMILFGGGQVGGFYGDTWDWDGTKWIPMSPTTSPLPREAASMAFDGATDQLLLFGGVGQNGWLGDTWVWDGTNWAQLHPANSPPLRSAAAMVYDSDTGQLILFGGEGASGALGDTWEWTGTTWTQLNPTTSPPARMGPASVYDIAAQAPVLFGGLPSASLTPLSDEWAWDGHSNQWKQLEGSPNPPNTPCAMGPCDNPVPPGRAYAAAAYFGSQIRDAFVIAGGVGGPNNYLGDVWGGDALSRGWTELSTAFGHAAGVAMAWDPPSDQLIAFGGVDQAGNLDDTTKTSRPVPSTDLLNTMDGAECPKINVTDGSRNGAGFDGAVANPFYAAPTAGNTEITGIVATIGAAPVCRDPNPANTDPAVSSWVMLTRGTGNYVQAGILYDQRDPNSTNPYYDPADHPFVQLGLSANNNGNLAGPPIPYDGCVQYLAPPGQVSDAGAGIEFAGLNTNGPESQWTCVGKNTSAPRVDSGTFSVVYNGQVPKMTNCPWVQKAKGSMDAYQTYQYPYGKAPHPLEEYEADYNGQCLWKFYFDRTMDPKNTKGLQPFGATMAAEAHQIDEFVPGNVKNPLVFAGAQLFYDQGWQAFKTDGTGTTPSPSQPGYPLAANAPAVGYVGGHLDQSVSPNANDAAGCIDHTDNTFYVWTYDSDAECAAWRF